jgi:hypothetical protein
MRTLTKVWVGDVVRAALACLLLCGCTALAPSQSAPAPSPAVPSIQALPKDPKSELAALASLNGLDISGAQRWHIKVAYDHFDPDGDNDSSGTYEEWWIGPKKYRRLYTSKNFSQTQTATERGLFLAGNQKWPGPVEAQVRDDVIEPLHRTTIQQPHTALDRTELRAGKMKLRCVGVRRTDVTMLFDIASPKYCFGPDLPVIRYSRGLMTTVLSYDNISTFQGRYVAREVKVTRADKPYLNIRIVALDPITEINEADFAPAAEAVPLGDRIELAGGELADYVVREPSLDRLRGRGTATVELVIGKDGRVTSAKGLEGPADVQRSAEDTARTIEFRPFLVLGAPMEVKTKWQFGSH